MKSTREAYGEALAGLGDKYPFYVMDADLSKATQTIQFAKKFPDRFIDMGIAEANLMAHAAGFAACKETVFASTFAMFAAGRAYEQIRNSIAYPNLNVKIGATHGGVLIGADGGSHQCIEDIALMRAIPNMVVLCPADTLETYFCVEAALQYDGPVYLRFGRMGNPEIYENREDCRFKIGKGTVVKDGTDVTIIAVGDMVIRAKKAAGILEQNKISAAVLDMASIKPIDKELICAYAEKTGCVVTAEDHNVEGGLGGAVSEILVKEKPVPVEMIGIQNQFGRSGTPVELEAAYQLRPEDVAAASEQVIKRKLNMGEGYIK